jgi:hypothetical protein
MVRTVLRTQSDLDALIDAVDATDGPVIVEDQGKPRLVAMSPEEFERYRAYVIEKGWAAVDELRRLNADKDPDEIYDIVTQAVEEVRQEHHDVRIKAPQRSR